MFNQVGILVKRNFWIFFKDPKRIFFTFMSPMFILIIFILFSRSLFKDALPTSAVMTVNTSLDELWIKLSTNQEFVSQIQIANQSTFNQILTLYLTQSAEQLQNNKMFQGIWSNEVHQAINQVFWTHFSNFNNQDIKSVFVGVQNGALVFQGNITVSLNEFFNWSKQNTVLSQEFTDFNAFKSMYLASLFDPKFANSTYFESIFNKEISKQINDFTSTLKGQYADVSLICGLLSVTTLTTAISLCSVMVEDNQKKVLNDFYITPIRTSLVRISYVVFNIAVNILITTFIYLIGMLYLIGTKSFLFSAAQVFEIFGVIILGSIINSAIFTFILSYLKSVGAFSALSASLSAGAGFLIGAFIPLSQMPAALREISSVLPSTQINNLFQEVIYGQIDIFANGLAANHPVIFGQNINEWQIVLYLLGWMVLVFAMNFFANMKSKRK
ncbi:ABC transporter permease [Mycoplasma hafezii]|uniref:ABC transporter permease n=1 Tax=Mycoplasma hafezii TaxID=525886 RepID=UPI003CF80895